MKKAPSTILAAAGITVGLLGFALPASAAPPPHVNSGFHWHTTGSSNKNHKNKKQPQRHCPPPPIWNQKPYHGHSGSSDLAESPNKRTTANGKKAPHSGPPPHTIKCQPPPPPGKGKGKGNWNGNGNWNGHGNYTPPNGYPTGPTGQKNGPLP